MLSSQLPDAPVDQRPVAEGKTARQASWTPRSIVESLSGALSFKTIGAAYVLVALVVAFSIAAPDTFPQVATIRQILNNNAVIALAALALIVPLAAGALDVSGPHVMALSGVMFAWMLVNTDLSIWPAAAVALGVAAVAGVVNAIVVVALQINALIGTLATGFIFQAIVLWRTDGVIVSSAELSGPFADIARTQWLTFTAPVFYAFAIALIIWFLLERTVSGRRIYATGFNREAARLAGVRTDRIQFCALIAGSVCSGVAGIVLASAIGSGDPTAGPPYLLPAFAAVFLGATQFKHGRFNAWGTVLAVVLLGTGTTGLGLLNQPGWVQNTFTGLVLIVALAVTRVQVRSAH